ncbi:uncharacterized protein LOC144364872 isoform X2 [Ictidomys tridecemlineatus]
MAEGTGDESRRHSEPSVTRISSTLVNKSALMQVPVEAAQLSGWGYFAVPLYREDYENLSAFQETRWADPGSYTLWLWTWPPAVKMFLQETTLEDCQGLEAKFIDEKALKVNEELNYLNNLCKTERTA